MKRIATLLLATASVIITWANNAPMDSLVNAFGNASKQAQTTDKQNDAVTQGTPHTAVSLFPLLHLPSSDAEINSGIMTMQYSKVDASVKKQITAAKRKKESTEHLENLLEICSTGESGLRGVDRVIIVDSIVIDKQNFLSAYPISPELGSLTSANKGETVQYQTQLNGMVFRPERSDDGIIRILRYYIENNQLTGGTPIEGLGIDGDINYPFLMQDGQTFYFSARSNDGYGNYDLYATRYDTDSKQFYHAENMGFPYNSYANDYMLVIDETANLGWFASDRYQPEGKVCIYTFIPNSSRHTIDYESTNLSEVISSASLKSIASLPLSDEQKSLKAQALQRANQLKSSTATTKPHDFEFVLNDSKTCYWLSDFTSPEAKKLCQDWLQKSKNLTLLQEQLQQLRNQSPSSTQQILNLETRVQELQNQVHQQAKQIRTVELSNAK